MSGLIAPHHAPASLGRARRVSRFVVAMPYWAIGIYVVWVIAAGLDPPNETWAEYCARTWRQGVPVHECIWMRDSTDPYPGQIQVPDPPWP